MHWGMSGGMDSVHTMPTCHVVLLEQHEVDTAMLCLMGIEGTHQDEVIQYTQ